MKPTKEQVIAWAREVDIDPHDMCEDPRIAENNLKAFATLAYEAGRKDENVATNDTSQERVDETEKDRHEPVQGENND